LEFFRLGDCHILGWEGLYFSLACRTMLDFIMYLERLKSVLSTERGLHLTFSSGDTEESIELSPEAADQTSKSLRIVTREIADEGPLTLTVLGHQVVRTHEAYGLLLRTQEFGDLVFALPQAILKRLITDLMRLESSPPVARTFSSEDATVHARGDMRARRP
jgi:hypothetical protein